MIYQLRFETAEDLFSSIPEVAEDMTAAPTSAATVDYLHGLRKSAIPEEAITFCAYLLPSREAVWWGHECMVYLKDLLTQDDNELLQMVRDWVENPTDENKHKALDAALSREIKTPCVWLACGAGWSGGSMTPPDQPSVPAPAFLAPRAINGAILSLLASADNTKRTRLIDGFVDMALHLIRKEDG